MSCRGADPLTRVQQATVLALVEAGRLDVVPADVARARSFLRQAEERLNQMPLLTSVVVKYGIAYDACHDTGERCWRRTASGPPTGPASTRRSVAICVPSSTSRLQKRRRESSTDRLRRARNQDRYEAKPVGAAATEKAYAQVPGMLHAFDRFDSVRHGGVTVGILHFLARLGLMPDSGSRRERPVAMGWFLPAQRIRARSRRM